MEEGGGLAKEAARSSKKPALSDYERSLVKYFFKGNSRGTPYLYFFVFQLNERIECHCTKKGGEQENKEVEDNT